MSSVAIDTRIRMIQAGIIGGLAAGVLYPVLLFVPVLSIAIAAAAFLGPAIGIGSIGLRQLIVLRQRSVMATLGAVTNVVAGALLTAMLFVQLAARNLVTDSPMDPHLVGVWLGLDVAWDVYIGLGTLLFAGAMVRHARFGWLFAAPGLALGALVIVLNLATFPTPPAEAGSFDIGPFVGLWYVAATVQVWRSLGWARGQVT